MLGPGIRALDLRGSLLAVADGNDLVTVNLASGDMKRLPIGRRIQSGYVVNDTTVLYSTHVSCGPDEPRSVVGRFNPTTENDQHIVDSTDMAGVEILWYNADADELTVTPRGCDPGLGQLWVLDAKTGEKKSSIPVEGCGWAAVSPTGSQVLVSNDLCNLGGEMHFPELQAYALPDGSVKQIPVTKDAPSHRPAVYAPDGKRAAFGQALDRDNPNGMAKSGGIWLLDTASLQTSKLWQDEGQESWAIDWSPDGSKLLVASRKEQNACSFSVVDVGAATATKIAGLSACDEKGTMVGFAALPQ
jgi:hypothetical protein